MTALRRLVCTVLLAAAAGFASAARAQSCPEGRADWVNLPLEIGSVSNNKPPPPYAFRCDTVIVPKGRTTVVYPGALLYFAMPNAANLIRVEGTLDLRGTKDHYVSLAGGLDKTQSAAAPAKAEPWGGILIDPGGKLTTDFAGFYGAATPITAFSADVKIENTFFTGGTGIIKPDGTLYGLDPQFTAINDLDFSAPASEPAPPPTAKAAPLDTLSAKEKAALFKSQHSGFWSRPMTWVVGGGVVLAAAVAYYEERPNATPNAPVQNPKPVTPAMDNPPPTNMK